MNVEGTGVSPASGRARTQLPAGRPAMLGLLEKYKKWWVALALAVLLGAGAWAATGAFMFGRRSHAIEASGTIQAEEIDISAQRAARLAKYEVDEGQPVRAGEVIAHLDTSDMQGQLEQAKAAARL